MQKKMHKCLIFLYFCINIHGKNAFLGGFGERFGERINSNYLISTLRVKDIRRINHDMRLLTLRPNVLQIRHVRVPQRRIRRNGYRKLCVSRIIYVRVWQEKKG